MSTHHSDKVRHKLYLLNYDYSPMSNTDIGEFAILCEIKDYGFNKDSP